jgi:uncharacterized protein YutE (UPF0331/DUF86 family)
VTPYLVERLAELRRHLDHLRAIRPRVYAREALERLPGFRNVLVHEYVALDLDRAIEALDRLEPVKRFLEIVRQSDVT